MAPRSDDYRIDDTSIDRLSDTDKRHMRTSLDHHKISARVREQVFGGADKPLGRGLEDISHLFLSQRTDGGPAIEHPSTESLERPQHDEREPESRARTVLLQPQAPVTKDKLAAILRGLEGALEDGLRAIDAAVPCHPCGEIDLLAVDRTNQLTIIDFEAVPNDGLLVRGIGHFHWIVENLPLVRRMYAEQSINFSVQPRLFLLAPQFSPLIRSCARQIARPRINWVRYHVVEVSGAPGVLFDPGVGE
ncbi:MAG: hypothetical protein EHM89_07490 [Acidobacteria bacterium]|nr:MAG: hypothetical protein EHM89_07490 [Acidobacteriota bacterium]